MAQNPRVPDRYSYRKAGGCFPASRLASNFQSIHAPADSSGTASLPSDRDGLAIPRALRGENEADYTGAEGGGDKFARLVALMVTDCRRPGHESRGPLALGLATDGGKVDWVRLVDAARLRAAFHQMHLKVGVSEAEPTLVGVLAGYEGMLGSRHPRNACDSHATFIRLYRIRAITGRPSRASPCT